MRSGSKVHIHLWDWLFAAVLLRSRFAFTIMSALVASTLIIDKSKFEFTFLGQVLRLQDGTRLSPYRPVCNVKSASERNNFLQER